MRTTKVKIGDTEYWMVNSLAALMAIDEIPKTVGPLRRTLMTIHQLLIAGHKWAVKHGHDAPEPPDFDTLLEEYTEEDMVSWARSMHDVMQGERNVQATPPKKKEGEPEA